MSSEVFVNDKIGLHMFIIQEPGFLLPDHIDAFSSDVTPCNLTMKSVMALFADVITLRAFILIG